MGKVQYAGTDLSRLKEIRVLFALRDKMSSLRLVRFEDPSDFVDSLRDYDTSAMNFCLGSLLDFINDSQDKPKAIQDSGARIMLAVYKENELM